MLNKAKTLLFLLCVILSVSFMQSNDKEYYVLKFMHPCMECSPECVVCPVDIIKMKRIKHDTAESFIEYLMIYYNCKFLSGSGDVETYGCCKFKDWPDKVYNVIYDSNKSRLDSNLYSKYAKVVDYEESDSLFKHAIKVEMNIDGWSKEVVFITKVHAQICSCHRMYYGPSTAPRRMDSVAVFSKLNLGDIEYVTQKEANAFVAKFSGYQSKCSN